MYPMAKVVLWASLECTNFSRAKGGQPRDADSRTLAEHLFRYIEALTPDYIQIENVEEFMSWGDLDENGKPISRDKGRLYTNWVDNVKAYGYKFDHRILNAADYGAYTSRKRFFGIFAKPYLPIVWPKPTHSKTGGGELSAKAYEAGGALQAGINCRVRELQLLGGNRADQTEAPQQAVTTSAATPTYAPPAYQQPEEVDDLPF